MSAETPTAELEPVVTQEVTQEEANIPEVQQEEEVQQVPLKTLQKERRKRQDLEAKTKLLEEQMTKLMTQGRQEPVDDSARYETVTRGDLDNQRSVDKAEIIRTVREEEWKEKNTQHAAYIDEHLQDLLDEKPHLAYAISNSKNRYQEAWDQLRGHGKLPVTREEEKREPIKRAVAPNSPANVSKSAGVSQTVDVMNMNDREFAEWRSKQIKRR